MTTASGRPTSEIDLNDDNYHDWRHQRASINGGGRYYGHGAIEIARIAQARLLAFQRRHGRGGVNFVPLA
jgi:hypothetical protein